MKLTPVANTDILNVRAPIVEQLPRFNSASSLVSARKPSLPVHATRPHAIIKAAKWFVEHFPGHIVYSVKSNPERLALQCLNIGGVERFDVASLPEVQLASEMFPDAKLYYMHPVKSREAIRSAYFEYGVKAYSLDSMEELYKILECTQNAQDLELFVRLRIPNDNAKIELSSKFGVLPEEATELLRITETVCAKLGLCFHVGSQSMSPNDFTVAIEKAKEAVVKSGVSLDVLDVGGGFPAAYPGFMPPALESYMQAIKDAVKDNGFGEVELICEPGRAMVAEGGSLIVRVELRKGDALYLNDGTFGSLFDAGTLKWNYPMRAMRLKGKLSKKLTPFRFYGPTCDSMDAMPGPFLLPSDIQEGDWIEIGQMGAYGSVMRTNFNGFGACEVAVLDDAPLLTMF
jgi:ornithine decarboxylase